MAAKGKMSLYYGDNGVHEFWESSNNEVLIFRNYGERWWITFIDGLITDGCSEVNVGIAVDKAAQLVGKNLEFDRTCQWKESKNGGRGDSFILLEVLLAVQFERSLEF